MWIAVIDSGICNLRSVTKALEVSGASVRVVTRPEEVHGAGGLVLPGVGALRDCVGALRGQGLDHTVRSWIAQDRPFLGICLGMQALFDYSEEGKVAGLGIFAGTVRRFVLPAAFKIPHMGWNQVSFQGPSTPLDQGLNPCDESFYFVHSYHCVPEAKELVWASCDYGGPFVAAVRRGRVYATQFHPEKSQAKGLQLYRNFVALCQV